MTIAGAAGAIAAVAISVAMVTGTISLVTTTGSSMRPGINHGDMVVVVRAASYAPGDEVAYRSQELGRVVLHRIASAEGGRFVLRGDANSWDDTDRPAPSDIMGRRLLLIPRGGRVLAALRSPWAIAALVVLLGALTAGGMRRERPRTASTRIPWSMRRLIVPVHRIGAESDAVETAGLRDLFRIADGFGLPVLLMSRAEHEDVYAVRAESVTYLHRVPAPPAAGSLIAIADRRPRRRTG